MGELNFNISEIEKTEAEIERELAEDFVNKVYGDMNDIKHSFFRIGFRLAEAARLRYYAKLGYMSLFVNSVI